jgi:hypothetical protein
LLKRASESAVRSTSALAKVSSGNLEGSDNRAWSAASFAELRAAETGGEGRFVSLKDEGGGGVGGRFEASKEGVDEENEDA